MEDAAGRIIDLYDRNADEWRRLRPGRVSVERRWLDRFVALLADKGAHVLDIGCGTGVPIARHLDGLGCAVTGIDSSPAMIALARAEMPGAVWHVGDMRSLDLGTMFDGLLAWNSFFHLTPVDQRGMFEVFGRHARAGSTLMFTSGPAAGVAMGAIFGEPLYHASLSPEEYRSLLDAAGFDVVAHAAEDPDCGGHTVWLARRRGGLP